ncbi:MAG: Fur family transcriptional regulator [Pseudomonadota bacterium]
MSSAADPAVAFAEHDHTRCATEALETVARLSKERGLRFTPLRRRVLEILLEEHRAMGAYDILDRLKAEGMGSKPPIAYRTLDFLVAEGFAHKIQRLNAFLACSHPGQGHRPIFLICRVCRVVAEAPEGAVAAALEETADRFGFTIERNVVEAEGLCPRCAAAGLG